MDSFFRLEACRAAMTCLRNGKTLKAAIQEAKIVSEINVQLWNHRREYQVRRWEKTCHDYLDRLERKIRNA